MLISNKSKMKNLILIIAIVFSGMLVQAQTEIIFSSYYRSIDNGAEEGNYIVRLEPDAIYLDYEKNSRTQLASKYDIISHRIAEGENRDPFTGIVEYTYKEERARINSMNTIGGMLNADSLNALQSVVV